MSEEFALCWNNFSDNFTKGFQFLLEKGDLFDVTLAVEGKLLKAHRVVLSICSPYFQEMFIAMPNNSHPIVVLKDMSSTLVSNLLKFMYVGSVNVEQAQLKEFMSIAETLKIKGLSTNTKENSEEEIKSVKRSLEDSDNCTPRKSSKRKAHIDLTSDDDDQIIPMPEISLLEVGFEGGDSNSRNSSEVQSPPSQTLKIAEVHSNVPYGSCDFPSEFNPYDISTTATKFTSAIPNEVSPSDSNITMLSATSLLHGKFIFNRNNTVATQAGLKTYWLCKGYRLSMCKARCITHQGKVISATGVHNHLPHMNNPNLTSSGPSQVCQGSSSLAAQFMQQQESSCLISQPPYFTAHQQLVDPKIFDKNVVAEGNPNYCRLEN